jgi:hypothetical protein
MIFAYRLIPHRVEAVRWRSDLTVHGMPSWLWASLNPKKTDSRVTRVGSRLHIKTPNGLAIVEEGDWIVRNSRRELEVYKSEQFDRTFERDERAPRNTKLRSWKEEKGER